MGITSFPGLEGFYWSVQTSPRIRFSDKFTVSLSIGYEKDQNDRGWVNTDIDSTDMTTIYFGRRDVTTINNILTVKYIFNTRASVSLRVRHYWSVAEYLEYYSLDRSGDLQKSDYSFNHDINYNAFTADLQFVWYFAPGSEMSIVWKNQINTRNDIIEKGYWNDFNHTITAPQSNSFSIRVLYYLDYLYLKKAFTKKKF
jgi:hypothetical protein